MRAVRSRSAAPYALLALLWGGFALATPYVWPVPTATLVGLAVGLLALSGMVYIQGGMPARIVIAPSRISVRNRLHRIDAPRHLVDEVVVLDDLGIYLRLTDGEMISLDAALSTTVGSYDRNARHRLAERTDITQLIDSVPRAASTGAVERSVRASSAVVAAPALLPSVTAPRHDRPPLRKLAVAT